MKLSTRVALVFLALAATLGLCAGLNIGMATAYVNATPRLNSGNAALGFGAVSAVAFAVSSSSSRFPLWLRVIEGLVLLSIAAWLSFAAFFWAFMAG
jgi:hypothetical protein